MSAPITVLIVDDHPTMRRGLADLFAAAPDIELVASAEDGEAGVASAADLRPHVVLMDVSMPGMSGIEAVRRLLPASPESRVVMLTSFAEHENIIESLNAGAIGYILKDASPEEILSGVRAAARGESPLSPRAATSVLLDRTSPRRRGDELTPREREVLQFVGRGLANKQIAWRMGISEKTVKAHLGNAFQRIGVEDRTSAALWARDAGLL